MYSVQENILVPFFSILNDIKEPYNQIRQILPSSYLHNGYIDIMKTSILEKNTISGNSIYPYIMNESDTIDIDNINDWKNAEKKNIN